ncbi:MAG: potassium channel family protein [Bacillota bacterium]
MKQYLIVGLGNFGASIAKSLMKENYEVFAIDKDEEKVKKFRDEVTYIVQGDASDRTVMESLDVSDFDVAIITTRDNVLASILATVILKQLGVPQVVSRAGTEMHANVLRQIGADEVVFPERDMGEKITQHLISSNINVIDYIHFTSDHSIVEIKPPDFMINKSLKESKLRSKFDLNVIAIRTGDDINISPSGDDVVHQEDAIVVVGSNEQLEKIKESSSGISIE